MTATRLTTSRAIDSIFIARYYITCGAGTEYDLIRTSKSTNFIGKRGGVSYTVSQKGAVGTEKTKKARTFSRLRTVRRSSARHVTLRHETPQFTKHHCQTLHRTHPNIKIVCFMQNNPHNPQCVPIIQPDRMPPS